MEEYRMPAQHLIKFMRGRDVSAWQIRGDRQWLPLVRVRKVRGHEVTMCVFLRNGEEESETIPWHENRWVEVRG